MNDCGVLQHDIDCLCDVIVTEPTPINYGLEDHWLLSMVANHFDVHLFNNGKEFGSLLEKCDKFLNVYFHEDDGGERVTSKFQRVREKAESIVASHNGDLTPTELCYALGMEEAEFVKCITFGNLSSNSGMTLEKMDRIVRMRREGMSHYKVCNILGIKNLNKNTGVAGWLSRTFIDPYDKVEA